MPKEKLFVFNEHHQSKMKERLEAMSIQISNQIKIRDELQSRMTDKEALFFRGFEMAPDFLKVGDEVGTKYGDEGRIVEVWPDSDVVTILSDSGEEQKIGTSRIAVVAYGNIELQKVPFVAGYDDLWY